HYSDHLDWFREIRRRPDTVIFAIRRTHDAALIGSCQLHSISAIHRSAELQIRIGEREDRGKGYGTEAVKLLLAHAYRDLNLHRVQVHVFSANPPALRLYETVGFKREGVLRNAVVIDGRSLDVLVMSILSSEYTLS
ncbi:MAG: GNAT family N-acetyltransferase, partial [Pyrinomonadaceae bacterium]